ncbi:hypothetical protein [Halobacillus amylolyticus]|uniref:Uncharacterized protein n=1 Tax=Halobacillus amylolyticus TaxID=2932259 RepID=A0ABY4HBV8_9BACI|nr:hypothetical protein [Halobacillus amylolyticus]UOR11415.1 hypothetical protein MUO15_17740 [Halobacillus amylolyticus]
MTDALLDFMLGPMRVIGDVYYEYQVIFNTLVVGFALYKMIFRGKKTQQSSAS